MIWVAEGVEAEQAVREVADARVVARGEAARDTARVAVLPAAAVTVAVGMVVGEKVRAGGATVAGDATGGTGAATAVVTDS